MNLLKFCQILYRFSMIPTRTNFYEFYNKAKH